MFEKRAYLLEITLRRPTESAFRRLIDRLAMCRYNEFYVYRTKESKPLDGKLSAYAAMKGIALKEIGRDELAELERDSTVSVATEAARSLAGRIEELRDRMAKAEADGRLRKCRRFLVTDFSDGFDWHSPVVSLPGIVLGGYVASVGAKASKIDLERELSLFLDAPIAGHLLRLGTLYLRGGAVRKDASEFFNILSSDRGYSRHPGLTDSILTEVSTIALGVMKALEPYLPLSECAKDLQYTALLLVAACNRRNEARLRTIKEELAKMWRRGFDSFGCAEALAKLPRF